MTKKIKPVRAWAVLIGGRISPYHIFDKLGDKILRRHNSQHNSVEVIIRAVAKKRSKPCKK